jgi:hypothetical protein
MAELRAKRFGKVREAKDSLEPCRKEFLAALNPPPAACSSAQQKTIPDGEHQPRRLPHRVALRSIKKSRTARRAGSSTNRKAAAHTC